MPGRSQARRLDGIVLANLLALGITIAAVPRYLHGELGASRFETGLATTIYFVAALVARPFIGMAVDRVGRRPFILVPPFVLAVLNLGFVWAHSVPAVAVLRLAGGGFAALFFTSVALSVTDVAPPAGRARALGRQSVMTYSGFAVGPVIADRLIRWGWTPTWLAPVGLYVLTGVLAIGIRETHERSLSTPPPRFGFDWRVFRPGVAVAAANFTFAAIVAFLPEYAERIGIGSPGALFACYALSVLTVRALTGSLADRMGPARYTLPAMSIGCLGLVVLATSGSAWQSFVGVALVGGGVGSTFPAATAAALARAGSERGKAMGTTLALGDIGQASSGPLVGWLSQSLGFRWVYGIPALFVAAAVATMATLPEVRGAAPRRARRAALEAQPSNLGRSRSG